MPKLISRDFPGGPVVRTSSSNTGVAGSISGQGPKIPQASRRKKRNVKQKQHCNRTLKMVHIKQSSKRVFILFVIARSIINQMHINHLTDN